MRYLGLGRPKTPGPQLTSGHIATYCNILTISTEATGGGYVGSQAHLDDP